jgi:hypothetical protein
MTHSLRLSKMKSKEQISCEVDSWIVEEELPVKANLKVIRKNDPNYGLTEDEIQDRNEFIRCYILKDFELLAMIPKQDTENDFFIADCRVDDPRYGAFNTVDFQSTQRPFNKYAYAMKKIMERVKELAIMHSCISDKDGRLETYQKYEDFVDRKFRTRLLASVNRYNREADKQHPSWLRSRIAELNCRILECKKIWGRYAPPENWDR